jgi:hypothetical protein
MKAPQMEQTQTFPCSPLPLTLPNHISASSLSAWNACRRKWFWRNLTGLGQPGSSIHLIAGAAFAAGLEAARKRAFSHPSPDGSVTVDQMLEAAYPAFMKEWGDHVEPDTSNKSKTNVFEAIRVYLTQHHPLTDIIQPLVYKQDGTPGSEFTFEIPLSVNHPSGDPYLFSGRFDLLGSYNGLPCVVDEKTTSQLGSTWASSFALRSQFLGYVWACRQLGFDLNTVIVRGVGLYKREIKIQTVIETYPDHLIERWHFNLINTLLEINKAWRRMGDNQLSLDSILPAVLDDACSSYSGCEYRTLCAAHDPEPFFSNYVQIRYNPIAKNPLTEPARSPDLSTPITIDL